jgi:cation-transporting ATPase E
MAEKREIIRKTAVKQNGKPENDVVATVDATAEAVVEPAVTELMADAEAEVAAASAPPAELGAPLSIDVPEHIVGLSYDEVVTRMNEGKDNGDQNVKTKTVGQIFRSNFFTFFNFLMIGLAVILAIFSQWTVRIPDVVENGRIISYMTDPETGEYLHQTNLSTAIANFGFLVVMAFNFIVTFWQELRAKRTIDKLSLLSMPHITVIRGRREYDIGIQHIVLDDIVILRTGNQICADCVVTSGEVEVNESQITGESDPVLKRVDKELLSGSFVVSGTATAKVIRVGKDNHAVKISQGAKYIKPVSSVALRSVQKFIKLMSLVIVPIGIAMFCVRYLIVGQPEGSILTGTEFVQTTMIGIIATLVGMIPSGVMLLTTGVFSISVFRISKNKALAQDIYCTENLARVDVLCLDKTGTITEGKMEVSSLVPNNMRDDDMMFILKNMMAALKEKSSTSQAIEDYTKSIDPTKEAVSIIPFSSARKWSAVEFENETYILGAAEFVLKDITKTIQERLDYFSEIGNRVLVLASCDSEIKNYKIPHSRIKFLGFVLITDKIRREAPDTLEFFDQQGVTVKIISGDNPLTVKAVAKRAGVKNYVNYIDMSTVQTEEELNEAALKYTIFGRVTPDQKLALVKALKANGHTVAMTGDGVNDVLALKEADCSIAMAAGSDAAKNVSQLVLLDSNFASMPKIVAEGRRSINNLERAASLYLVKTGYMALLAILFTIMPLLAIPYLPIHITLIGMVTISIPSLFLAIEPNEERITGNFFLKIIKNAWPASLVTAIAIAIVALAAPAAGLHNTTQVATVCVIVASSVGFAYLFKISWPFNVMRLLLLQVMIALLIGVHFIDFQFLSLLNLYGLTNEFTSGMFLIMFPTIAGSILLFVGIVQSPRLIKKWIKYKNEKRLKATQPAVSEEAEEVEATPGADLVVTVAETNASRAYPTITVAPKPKERVNPLTKIKTMVTSGAQSALAPLKGNGAKPTPAPAPAPATVAATKEEEPVKEEIVIVEQIVEAQQAVETVIEKPSITKPAEPKPKAKPAAKPKAEPKTEPKPKVENAEPKVANTEPEAPSKPKATSKPKSASAQIKATVELVNASKTAPKTPAKPKAEAKPKTEPKTEPKPKK